MPHPPVSVAASSPAPTALAPSKLQVFWRRLLSTVVLWGLLAGAVVFKVGWPFHALICVLGLGSLWEYLQMDREVPRSSRLWVMAMGIFYYAGLVAHFSGVAWVSLDLLDGLFPWLVLTGVFVPTFFRPLEGQKTLWQVIYPAFGFFYVAYLFSFLSRILFTTWSEAAPQSGVMCSLFVVLATKFTDSGAYVVGSLIGKHKMIPHISPGKTWEGLIGAFIGAVGAGLLLKWGAGAQMAFVSWTAALVLCLLIAIVCVAGDLAESVIKRCLNIKDSGATLPGIGGALDLTDSLLWTAPLFYLYLRHAA